MVPPVSLIVPVFDQVDVAMVSVPPPTLTEPAVVQDDDAMLSVPLVARMRPRLLFCTVPTCAEAKKLTAPTLIVPPASTSRMPSLISVVLLTPKLATIALVP